MEGSTGRNTHQDTFLASCQSSGGEGILVRYGEDFVIDAGVQHSRDKACTDSLDFVSAAVTLAEDRGILGFHCHEFHGRVLLL